MFFLAAMSIWCLLAEFYHLCPMRTFTLYVMVPATALLILVALIDLAKGDQRLWRAVVIGAVGRAGIPRGKVRKPGGNGGSLDGGLSNSTEAGLFQLQFGLGTGGNNGQQQREIASTESPENGARRRWHCLHTKVIREYET